MGKFWIFFCLEMEDACTKVIGSCILNMKHIRQIAKTLTILEIGPLKFYSRNWPTLLLFLCFEPKYGIVLLWIFVSIPVHSRRVYLICLLISSFCSSLLLWYLKSHPIVVLYRHQTFTNHSSWCLDLKNIESVTSHHLSPSVSPPIKPHFKCGLKYLILVWMSHTTKLINIERVSSSPKTRLFLLIDLCIDHRKIQCSI